MEEVKREEGSVEEGRVEEGSVEIGSFDDIFGEDLNPPQEGVMDLGVFAGGEGGRTETGYEVRKARRQDKKTEKMSGMFGNTGWLGNYAHKSKAAKVMFEGEVTKPRWAVEACVLLRDQGVCRVCGCVVKSGWVVGQLVPRNSGGLFSETNCMLMCRDCGECWHRYKNFDTGDGVEWLWLRVRESVLKRRLRCFRDCKGLGSEQIDMYREVRDRCREFARSKETELKVVQKRIGGQVGTKVVGGDGSVVDVQELARQIEAGMSQADKDELERRLRRREEEGRGKSA